MVAEGVPADAILTSVLDKSGYLSELHGSTDPQDETRLENLRELITVAREFVSGVAALTAEDDLAVDDLVDEFGVLGARGGPRPRGRSFDRLRRALAAGAAEPDASLGAFLERVALVADSDQIPDTPEGPTPAWSP